MFSKGPSISYLSHRSSLAARAIIAGAALAVAAGTGMFAATTRANTTIYQDSFNRTGGLNGSTPTIDTGDLGGTVGATWLAINPNGNVADTGWATSTTDGGQLTYSGNPSTPAYDATAWLPFTPQTGQVYTAQTTFVARTTGTAADWVGFFFDNSSGLWGAGTNPWTFVRPSLSAHSDAGYVSPTAGFVGGPTAGGTSSSGTYTSDTIVTSMILNTTTPSNWTVQFKWNDLTNPVDSVTSAVTALGGTTVANQIGFVIVPPATGTITNFSLTAVPEPATLGLFAIGGLALMALRRRMAKTSGVRD